jgi:hypothetical protein
MPGHACKPSQTTIEGQREGGEKGAKRGRRGKRVSERGTYISIFFFFGRNLDEILQRLGGWLCNLIN